MKTEKEGVLRVRPPTSVLARAAVARAQATARRRSAGSRRPSWIESSLPSRRCARAEWSTLAARETGLALCSEGEDETLILGQTLILGRGRSPLAAPTFALSV
eukprot:944305-Pleurochrysis_carterae.AAC.1